MATKKTITRRQFEMLQGLSAFGQAFLSASEVVDAQKLRDEGLVAIYSAPVMGTKILPAWEITAKGRKVAVDLQGKLK